MTSTRKTITSDYHGSGGTTTFDDKLSLKNINTAKISRIAISHDAHLRTMTVHYTDVVGVTRGVVAGTNQVELTLEKNEFITTVEGAFGDGVISKIGFETSSGKKWGPFGKVEHSSTFNWGGYGPGMGLLYFDGKTNSYIHELRATFATYQIPVTRPVTVKYEKHLEMGPDTLPLVPLTKFASNLMSSTVTLIIGPDSATFHVPKDILCVLPFFRAALQGKFREASDNKISMPEDEPQNVAALIEFLYTGSYTYPFRPATEVEEEGEEASPAADYEEGAYHVGVYSTADKYECMGLMDAALKAFIFVLGELKGVNVLRLWKAAYAKDLFLRAVQDKEELWEFRNGLAGLLKELYLSHPTEMERTTVDCPVLLHDLLRLVVCHE